MLTIKKITVLTMAALLAGSVMVACKQQEKPATVAPVEQTTEQVAPVTEEQVAPATEEEQAAPATEEEHAAPATEEQPAHN